jgi:hypothetical protein
VIRAVDDRGISVIEKMLDQYGLAYICLNPRVLFGDGPARAEAPAHVGHGGGMFAAGRTRGYEGGHYERLSCRVAEAFEVLRRLYAPWPADYARPQPPSHERAGYRP